MSGKHRPGGGAPVGKIAAVVAAVLVVIGGVAATKALTSDDTAGTASATLTTTPPAETTPAPAETATDDLTGTSTATVQATPADDPAVTALLAACRSEVTAREQLLAAAKASYRDWSTHVGAQKGLDNGTKTIEQARAEWAASKARGPADLAAYTKAETALRSANGGCGSLAKADTSTFSDADAATACVARAAGLAKTEAAGNAVNKAWADHVAMMKTKEHTPHAQYNARWLAMVNSSGSYLATFSNAAAGSAKLPACPA